MNKLMKIGLSALVLLAVVAGTTHIWLPSSSNACQRDISHQDHLWSLPPFHCLGHSEFSYETGAAGQEIMVWDHLHTWMTIAWFLEQGFSVEEATEFTQSPKN